jgi:hypothetical protein
MSHAELSVVLVTDHFRTIRRVIQRLQDQTARDRIEVVIVTPSAQGLELDAEATTGLASVRVVEVGSISPMPRARAAGVRATTAPLIFLGETHSYAHPGFAAAVIAAHDGPWDVVVPGLDNGNPESALSWAGFLSDYGTWHRALAPGEIGSGPTWNVAYKRESLLALGDNLEHALSSGDELWSAFRAQGRKWYHAPDAPSNTSTSRDRSVGARTVPGGLHGRSEPQREMVFATACGYLLASPLIVIVLLSRLRTPLRAVRSRQLPAGTMPRWWRASSSGRWERRSAISAAPVENMNRRWRSSSCTSSSTRSMPNSRASCSSSG